MAAVLGGTTLFLLITFFFVPCSSQMLPPTIFRVPSLHKGLNNQRMRIVQDITMATLIGAAVELPKQIASRMECNFDAKCARRYFSDTSFWQVFDKKITTERLLKAGVNLQNSTTHDPPVSVRKTFPIAATSLSEMTLPICSSPVCSFGPMPGDCCVKLIPNTPIAVHLLKSVNHAFESAQRYRIVATKVLSAFKKKTQQNFTVTMHWRLDDDFIQSSHQLSSKTYCLEFLKGLGLARNRTLPSDSTSKVHVLVLGERPLLKVEKLLRDWLKEGEDFLYTLHSKDTLLDKSEFNVLGEIHTDLKGQLDFELGVKSDFFLGSPFSSFSVLIAFYRFGSPHHKPTMTSMANVDVKDHLGSLFSAIFPYSPSLAVYPHKCTQAGKAFSPFQRILEKCIMKEKEKTSFG